MHYARLGFAGLLCLSLSLTAYPQTSTQLVRTDPLKQYKIFKDAYIAEHEWDLTIKPDPSITYDLTYCAAAMPDASTRDDLTSDLYGLAADTNWIARTLKWTGYPSTLWEDDLAKYESNQLSKISKKGRRKTGQAFAETEHFATALLDKLENYRKSGGSSMPVIDWAYACGGHGTEITVLMAPSRGKVRLMSMFFYRVCAVQGLDTDDLKKCDQWIEYRDGDMTYLAGIYQYWATWQGGQQQTGRRDFDETVGFEKNSNGFGWVWRIRY
jgi:hypothetical protein